MLCRLLPAIFALMVSSASAQQVQNGQVFGVWRVNCTAIAVGQTACVLGQEVRRETDNAFIAQIMAFQTPDASKTFLSARVPLGVYLPRPFVLRAEDEDEEARVTFTWQACSNTLCEAVAEIEEATLARLAGKDRTILAAFRPNLQSKDFVFRFALTGAPEGLDALRTASE